MSYCEVAIRDLRAGRLFGDRHFTEALFGDIRGFARSAAGHASGNIGRHHLMHGIVNLTTLLCVCSGGDNHFVIPSLTEVLIQAITRNTTYKEPHEAILVSNKATALQCVQAMSARWTISIILSSSLEVPRQAC